MHTVDSLQFLDRAQNGLHRIRRQIEVDDRRDRPVFEVRDRLVDDEELVGLAPVGKAYHAVAAVRSETGVSGELLSKLPLFIDMVLIEGIVDEFECAAREGEDVDPEDIEDYATCLTEHIPYAGIGVEL